jgi:protein SCO1/2
MRTAVKPKRRIDWGTLLALAALATGLLWLVQTSGWGLSQHLFWPVAFACAGAAQARSAAETMDILMWNREPVGGPFELIDQDGKTVRDTDFAGKYRLVYFGYTYCPDVCPTDVQKMGRVLRTLEKQDPAYARQIQPIFITIDPERDKPAQVKQFVTAFHPRIVGLTGTPQQIAAVAKAYGAYFKKMEPSDPGGAYLMDHAATIYLMGKQGEPLALITREMTEQEMIAEIRKWAK